MKSLYFLIDRVWQWIAERVFVRFEFELPLSNLKTAAASGQVYFALTAGGLVEWLILSSWCRREGFGPILITNRLGLLLLGKPLVCLSIVFRRRTWSSAFTGNDTAGPRLVFCRLRERRKLFEPTGVEALLASIYKDRSALGPAGQIAIVPVLVTWRKYLRGASRNPSEYLFGLSSSPNLVGKIWFLIRRRKDSMVKGLTPFSLVGGLAAGASDVLGESEALRVGKSARRKILVATTEEMRIMLGPRYVSPTAVKETLLHDSEIQAVIESVALDEGLDKRKVMLQAYQILTEVVANYSYRFIEVMYVCLTWLFTRVFDGLDFKSDEMERLRETVRQKPVIFVATHRSHLDYLVIPYMLFLQDIVTPHVAAGINLSFWPIGSFLRRGGAFFIRRSFRGERLYSLLLRKYINFLIQSRFNILFFIEGTRSRTGKLLPPAYGILKMVFEAFRERVCDDIALVPVSILYDEVLEQSGYARELTGVQKSKESARSLLRSRRIVRRNIGKVYVRLADSVSMKDVFRDIDVLEMGDRLALQKTAFELCTRINRATAVTPKAILSMILLSQSEPITFERVVIIAQQLSEYALRAGYQVVSDEPIQFRRSIEALLRQFHRSGVIQPVDGSLPMAFELDRSRRTTLIFYRNNAIHCFVVPAIAVLSLGLLAREGAEIYAGGCREAVIRTSLILRNLFKFDFFFASSSAFVAQITQSITVVVGDAEWEAKGPQELLASIAQQRRYGRRSSVFRCLLGDLSESYLTVGQFIKTHLAQKTDKKALLQRLVKESQQSGYFGSLVFPESVSVQNYSSALSLFENLGMLSMGKEADKTWVEKKVWDEKGDALLKQLQSLVAIASLI